MPLLELISLDINKCLIMTAYSRKELTVYFYLKAKTCNKQTRVFNGTIVSNRL
jgi:hypothetical protein